MGLFAQLTVNGLIAGSIYALVASGFSLIYGTNKFMHFAHGSTVAISGYFLFSLFNSYSINFYISAILTIFLAGVLGWLIYKVIYLPMQKRNASNVVLLIASIGVLILIENLIQVFYGSDVKVIGFLEIVEGIEFLGASITPLQIIIFIVSIVLLISLNLFMKKTKLGRDMRAVSENKELAGIVGIDYQKVASYSFVIGSMLAGIAGILIGLEQNLSPTMGTLLIIKGFTGAVIGGITSVPASVVGSYILGLAENWGVWLLPSGFKDAIAFGLLFLFLLFRPNGLFGMNKGVKDA
jgi:branched-chain amino acid transport system permease protein